MNERIEKLLEQCRIETYGVNGMLLEFGFDAEKFAELIVQECMEVAGDSYTSTPEDCVYYVDLAVNRIAEHFGVEE